MKRILGTSSVVAALALMSACGAAPSTPDTSDPKIVGGTVAAERPFMAGLVAKNKTSAFCGGTFIERDVVMTAAHCVYGRTAASMRIAGGHRMNKDLTNDVTRAVRKIVVHAGYNGEQNDDIALIFVEPETTDRAATSRMRPVGYSTDAALPETAGRAIVAGWGSLTSGGRFPDELREVNVPIVTTAACVGVGGLYTDVTDHQVCAGDLERGGIDSCQGDSGGPLFVENGSGGVEVIGVVSWGDGCAARKKPGVYTRVASYGDWIRTKLAAR